jgi:phenylpyruvate tautomerase PptA (4-oxalocrotonate tautomerase family)
MPMLDAYIPEGALSPEAEDKLVARLTTFCCSTRESTRRPRPRDRRAERWRG